MTAHRIDKDGNTIELSPSEVDGLQAESSQTRTKRLTREAEEEFVTALNPITSLYPDLETKLWDRLETEARAWEADNSATTIAIDLVVAKSGEDKATYVASIIAKADIYLTTAFSALGDKRKTIIDLG